MTVPTGNCKTESGLKFTLVPLGILMNRNLCAKSENKGEFNA